jgi:hypothetical protein
MPRRGPSCWTSRAAGTRTSSSTRTAGGCGRSRFWTSLHANHRVHPVRLAVYWSLAAAVVLGSGFGLRYAADAMELWRDNEAVRRSMTNSVASSGFSPFLQQATRTHGSLAAYLDAFYPVPPSRRFFAEVDVWDRRALPLKLTLAAVLWPAATFATLMIFVASMNRARVRRVHVLRCAVYSGDVAVWAAVPWLVALLFPDDLRREEAAMTALAIAVVLWIVASYRLLTAYRYYLRFENAGGVVLATQVIVGLAAACVFVRELVWLFF